MMVIYVPFKFEFDRTNRFQVMESGNKKCGRTDGRRTHQSNRRVGYQVLVKVLYCKLLTIGKKLPSFPHRVGFELPTSEMGGECATTMPLWPLSLPFINHSKLLAIFDVPTMSISFLLSRDKDLKN